METEVLLSPVETDELAYRFDAGVSNHQFTMLNNYMKKLLGITAERSSKGAVTKRTRICQVELMATNDHFCEVERDGVKKAVRVSFLPHDKEPLEAIRKERLVKMDVYTGCEQHTEDEALSTAVVDFRIAVNLEYKGASVFWNSFRTDPCGDQGAS